MGHYLNVSAHTSCPSPDPGGIWDGDRPCLIPCDYDRIMASTRLCGGLMLRGSVYPPPHTTPCTVPRDAPSFAPKRPWRQRHQRKFFPLVLMQWPVGWSRLGRGCHKDAQPFFFFLLRQPLSDVWWLPTNRHRLPTNRHRLPTNRHQLPTNRHQLHTNRHRLPTNRHGLPTNRHRLHTNRHRLHTNRHRLHTNRHRLHTNRHRLPTNRHQLPTGRHHRAYWTLRVFFFYSIMATPAFGFSPTRGGGAVGTRPRYLIVCLWRRLLASCHCSF